MTEPRIVAVVMAGGSGTRFWPASTADRPKQLSRIVGDRTMLQATVDRVRGVADDVLIITTARLADATRAQVPDLAPGNVIAEPQGRDTGPCVALAAAVVQTIDPDAVMVLLPADHVIEPVEVFEASIRRAAAIAAEGHLVTFGVPPRFASTGFGYIHATEVLGSTGGLVVDRFVEKPDAATAESYLEAGGYYWNSGIFCWSASTVLRELERHCPDMTERMTPAGAAWGTVSFDDELKRAYGSVTPISIDYALMEKADDVAVVVADWTWDDLGSWDAVYDHFAPDEHGMVITGDVIVDGCSDSLVYQLDGPPIAAVGLDDVIVVSTANGILVVPRGRSQDVKQVVERLKAEGRDDLL